MERKVMEMLLAGDDPVLQILREQYRMAEAIEREKTGVGFHVTFTITPGVRRLDDKKSLHFGDVKGDIEGLEFGAGFVLHVRDGAIDQLEGYSYGEPWPVHVESFSISYIEGERRDLNALWTKWTA